MTDDGPLSWTEKKVRGVSINKPETEHGLAIVGFTETEKLWGEIIMEFLPVTSINWGIPPVFNSYRDTPKYKLP